MFGLLLTNMFRLLTWYEWISGIRKDKHESATREGEEQMYIVHQKYNFMLMVA